MKNYIVLPLIAVTQKMIDECLETSFETLKISKNNNTVLKWNGTIPKSLTGVSGKFLDYEQIKEEFKKDEWQGGEI